MKIFAAQEINKIVNNLSLFFKSLKESNNKNSNQMSLDAWFKDKGDKQLKFDYNSLDENSVVFDLGGYEGQWSSDIFSKYCPYIHIFEPVEHFSKNIEARFSKNSKIFVHNFGLANKDCEAYISIDKFNSSIVREINTKTEKIKLKEASSFIDKMSIRQIDLIKINIEGSEYDLLEYLIETKMIQSIKNILVQFHPFVPDADVRMKNIQRKLLETHNLKWQYKFVWESWEYKG